MMHSPINTGKRAAAFLPLAACLLLLTACAKPQSYTPPISAQERQQEAIAQKQAAQAAAGQGALEDFTPTPAQFQEMKARMSATITQLRPQAIGMCQSIKGKNAACEVPIVLSPEAKGINAFADGQRIVVSPAIMEFTKDNPEQFAFVVIHEYVHHFMGHIASAQQNVAIGALAGIIGDALAQSQGISTNGQFSKLGASAGRLSYSPEFEQEADYIALYILSRAGVAVEKAPDFWRRMAAVNPQGIYNRSTHPTTPERFVGMQKTIAEIQQKTAAGQPLMPNLRTKS